MSQVSVDLQDDLAKVQRNTAKIIIDNLISTITSSSDEDVDRFLMIFRPNDDKHEMGGVYEHILGYNPITLFDRTYLEKKYDELIDIAPDNYQEALIIEKKSIIDNVMTAKENIDDEYLLYLLATQIAVTTGWNDPVIKPNLLFVIHDKIEDGGGFELESDIEEFNEDDESSIDDDDSFDGPEPDEDFDEF